MPNKSSDIKLSEIRSKVMDNHKLETNVDLLTTVIGYKNAIKFFL